MMKLNQSNVERWNWKKKLIKLLKSIKKNKENRNYKNGNQHENKKIN